MRNFMDNMESSSLQSNKVTVVQAPTTKEVIEAASTLSGVPESEEYNPTDAPYIKIEVPGFEDSSLEEQNQ